MEVRLSRRLAALSLLAVFAAMSVLAGDDVWTVAGQPSGGQTFQVAVDPVNSGTLYALTNNGLFKSTDGGTSWHFAYAVFGYNMSVDPIQPANLYVANIDSGIWKSTDGGAAWKQLGGISAAHVVVADPATEGVVYAIADGCDVYKSVNGGASWSVIDKTSSGVTGLTGNADAYCTQIAVDPLNPQQLYLSTQVGAFDGSTGMRDGSLLSGLYASTDGGATWTQHLATLGFADVVVDPGNDQNVYAGTYVSNDAGVTWAPAATDPPFNFTVITVDPVDSRTLWGVDQLESLWFSSDQGTTWTQPTMPYGDSIYNVVYDPGNPATLYAADVSFGVYKSSDGGSSWAEATAGLAGVFALDVLADSTGAIYMGTEGTGIFKSTDGGATWAMKDAGISVALGSDGIWAQSLVEASTPGTLYFAARLLGGVYKTTDGGDSWTALSSSIAVGSANVVAVDPQQAQTVYIGTGGGQVLKSIDGGANWTSSVSGLPVDGIWSIAVDPTNSKVIYAGGFSSGLFKSTDGGVTWSTLLENSGYGVDCEAVDPTNPQIVYACVANKGIEKSTDGGRTWAEAGDTPAYAFQILEVDPQDPDVIFACIPGFAVFMSTDAGAHWDEIVDPSASDSFNARTEAVTTTAKARTSSLSRPVTISGIALDPRHANRLYGAGNDGKLYARGIPGAHGSATPANASGSSGGGGAFPLLGSLLLLGFAALRRKH